MLTREVNSKLAIFIITGLTLLTVLFFISRRADVVFGDIQDYHELITGNSVSIK